MARRPAGAADHALRLDQEPLMLSAWLSRLTVGLALVAGSPRKRAMITMLTKLAVDELGEGAMPLEYALGWIASGKSINSLAASLEALSGYEISSAMLASYLHKQPVPDAAAEGAPASAKDAIARAREESAHIMAEQTVDIIDVTPLNTDAIARARLMISARQWLAGKWNRKAYGDDKQAPAQINIGSLHLAVLRAHSPGTEAPKLPAPATQAIEGEDYDVVHEALPPK